MAVHRAPGAAVWKHAAATVAKRLQRPVPPAARELNLAETLALTAVQAVQMKRLVHQAPAKSVKS